MVSKKIEYYDVIEYPIITEKAVDLISTSNRLTFMLNTNTTKNIVLSFIGIDKIIYQKKWITLYDKKAKRDLFTVK